MINVTVSLKKFTLNLLKGGPFAHGNCTSVFTYSSNAYKELVKLPIIQNPNA